MNRHDAEYSKMVDYVLSTGVEKSDRTGTGTKSVFGYQMRFNLHDGTIPLLTTKKMFTRGIIHEILWYMQAGTNIKYLTDNNVHIWDEWADPTGDLGPVYGAMWRKWPDAVEDCATDYIDQIAELIHTLKTNPDSRRMMVTAWNPGLLPDTSLSFATNVSNGKQALPPCHYTFQCYSQEARTYDRIKWAWGCSLLNNIDLHNYPTEDLPSILDSRGVPTRKLSLILNQRSADVALGVPFNIVQYSIMVRMFAQVTGHLPGELIWNGGDVHIYNNHVDGLKEQLLRTSYQAPRFSFARPVENIDDFGYNDFIITGYQSHSKIDFKVAI
jgi:thymidylate synthase